MEAAQLKAKLRQKAGRGVCHSLRRQGEVPGVLYGKGIDNMLVEFSEMELNDIIKNQGEHAVINIDVNGSVLKTMIKEIQRNPVDRRPVHIDLKCIREDEKLHAEVPIMVKGEGAIRSKGGIVQKQLGTVEVEATPDQLPKFILADVSRLEIGDKITVADMEFASEISILSDINSIVATITYASEKEDTTTTSAIEPSQIPLAVPSTTSEEDII
ncbi:50S ribosomal protein L25 [Oxobacter pfennigii]|uniref:Large ribosomal subunit protein bL25 n=1 Tax=Oxobacter pfennigii TaxID=36849 RepID=A0A0P8YDQ0_9CLOT|nr:50S ribosomal protein L25 [Oxobacter pfennigii]KPU45373.1 50S ribosomal protein L25 [Oxobacter pfennigii]